MSTMETVAAQTR